MRSKKAIYNIISNFILEIIIIIYGLIIPKAIIKEYGSEVNGLVASISQFLGYIALLEAGVGPVVKSALYKSIAKKDNKNIANILRSSEKFFRNLSFIFIIYLIGLSFIYPLFVNKSFDYFYTLSLVLIISISTFFEYYFGITYKLYLQSEQKMYVTSLIQILTYLLNIILIITIIKLKVSIHFIKLISGIIFILRPIIQNIYVKKKYNINLNIADDNYKLEKKWDGLAQHIAAVINNNTDIVVLTLFSKLTEVSVYSVYNMVFIGIRSIVEAFVNGLSAAFGDIIAQGKNDILNKNFSLYELSYFILITIIYSCTIILLIPFIKLYTMGINDTSYIRVSFGIVMVVSQLIYAIRLPYNSLVLAAGHFKETRIGAWIEALSNIIISVILVIKFGIIGVAIGTLVAMIIRTVEYIYYTNKYILYRNIFISLKKILIVIINVLFCIYIVKRIPLFEINSYISWLSYAVITFIVTSIITVLINVILYRNDTRNLKKVLINNLRKKKV